MHEIEMLPYLLRKLTTAQNSSFSLPTSDQQVVWNHAGQFESHLKMSLLEVGDNAKVFSS